MKQQYAHQGLFAGFQVTPLLCVAFLPFILLGLELSQDPRESYVLKTTKWRTPPRLVLNARRAGFDLPEGVHHHHHQSPQPLPRQQPWELSAQVLRAAFKVHADPGNKRLVSRERGQFFCFCLWVTAFFLLRALVSRVFPAVVGVAWCRVPQVSSHNQLTHILEPGLEQSVHGYLRSQATII